MNSNQSNVASRLFASASFVAAYVGLLNLHGTDGSDDTVNGHFRQLINRTSIDLAGGGVALKGSQTRESREVLRQYFHRNLANRVSTTAVQSAAQTSTTEGNTMSAINASAAVSNVTYVFGKPINTVTDDEIFAAIRKLNKDIATLKETGVESRALARRIGGLQEQIAQLVEVADSRVGGE